MKNSLIEKGYVILRISEKKVMLVYSTFIHRDEMFSGIKCWRRCVIVGGKYI